MKNIASAFVKAKKAFAPAMKTSTNPHFKSKYADLAACVEAVDDAFLDNGIVMYQETSEDSTGVTVETVLLHESGEMLRCGKLHVPAQKNDPQGYGSALSYARRYSLMAACGIAPEDDDGNAASRQQKAPRESAKPITKSVFDTMPPDEQQFLSGLADEIKKKLSDDKQTGAKAYLEAKSSLDADEQTALWSLFDSKQRSDIKKYGVALAEQA